ncbi:hypothetical protein P7K49_039679, partial [Saguinus oedipus]
TLLSNLQWSNSQVSILYGHSFKHSVNNELLWSNRNTVLDSHELSAFLNDTHLGGNQACILYELQFCVMLSNTQNLFEYCTCEE